ncbi:MAG: ABC transporter ATP-binding protein/permease [Clostridia bacterium]|nr:ABC transporter ATP-binding protein/permease [Clostridia bacterium]
MSENSERKVMEQNEKMSPPAARGGPGGGRPGGGSGERAKDFTGSLKKLLLYCKPFLPVFAVAVIADIIGVVVRLIGPGKISDITSMITENITGEIDIDGIVSICVFLIVLYVIGAAASYASGLIMTLITQRLNYQMRDDISKKITRLPIAYFQKTSTGDVLSRVTNDVDTVGQTIQNSVSTLISAVTMFVGCIFVMFATDGRMALTAILSSVIGFVFMLLIMNKSQKYFRSRQIVLGNLNGHVEEIYSGHNIVRLFNGEGKEKEKFDKLNQEMCDNNRKSQFFSGLMQPLMSFIGNFGYVAVCIVGALLTLNGSLDLSVIVAFMMYVRLFTSPLSQMAQAATNLQSGAAASERVFEFLEAEEMSDESALAPHSGEVRGEVDFSHVHFGYTPDKIIINDFNCHVNPGEQVAIVGPTGAGKTTMVNLLMRFYDVNSGSIKIDGTPTSEISRHDVHDMFGMVLQDTWLFYGTIRENLTYGKKDVTDEELDKICAAAGLSHFIRTLPDGYDTILDESLNLSAGQKQLLTIARAMVENAPMLILDEATSSVDTRTEVLIQEAMRKLTEGRTSFVIAHRLSTIRNADKILVMRGGDIVEAGTHDELMAMNGFYAELYSSQFANEEAS